MFGSDTVVTSSQHAEVVGVNEGIVVARTVELTIGGGGAQRLSACRTFGQASNLESLGRGVANYYCIAVTA